MSRPAHRSARGVEAVPRVGRRRRRHVPSGVGDAGRCRQLVVEEVGERRNERVEPRRKGDAVDHREAVERRRDPLRIGRGVGVEGELGVERAPRRAQRQERVGGDVARERRPGRQRPARRVGGVVDEEAARLVDVEAIHVHDRHADHRESAVVQRRRAVGDLVLDRERIAVEVDLAPADCRRCRGCRDRSARRCSRRRRAARPDRAGGCRPRRSRSRWASESRCRPPSR